MALAGLVGQEGLASSEGGAGFRTGTMAHPSPAEGCHDVEAYGFKLGCRNRW